MAFSSARALLLVLFKSNQTTSTVVPSIFSSLGQVHHYGAIASRNDQGWTNALVTQVTDEQKLNHLDPKPIHEALQKAYQAENITVAPMVYSIECVKDKSNDPENDVFFAVAFSLTERLEEFPQDWFKATPYMSSCSGYKRSTVYKVIGENPSYPYINMAIWSSLDAWTKAIATEESKQAHAHQNHVQRTAFIGKLID